MSEFTEGNEKSLLLFFFFQAEDGIRDRNVTGVQTCALPICSRSYGVRSPSRVASGRLRHPTTPTKTRGVRRRGVLVCGKAVRFGFSSRPKSTALERWNSRHQSGATRVRIPNSSAPETAQNTPMRRSRKIGRAHV